MKHWVAAEPENIINIAGFAPIHHFQPAIMAVAAHQDMHFGPVPPDPRDDTLEDGTHFHAGRRLAFAQDHCHRLAAGAFVDMDRQKTALVVVRVEQRELLLAVNRIERVVDVEDDRSRCPRPAGAKQVHHRTHHPRNLCPARRVLQPRHCWLRAQWIAALRGTTERHFEHRIMSQRRAVVAVLVACRNRKHPQPQHLHHRMVDPVRVAVISQTRRQSCRDAQPLLDTAQQQHAGIR